MLIWPLGLIIALIDEELDKEQISILKKAFEAFDQEKKGCIGTVMVGTILGMLGHQVSDDALKEIIDEVDVDAICNSVNKSRDLNTDGEGGAGRCAGVQTVTYFVAPDGAKCKKANDMRRYLNNI
uniref:EF-hand domain-containing protein n=1 Tax=Heliothis virescens TaxID=7102 RepID=A0A2A4K5X6_HELVI